MRKCVVYNQSKLARSLETNRERKESLSVICLLVMVGCTQSGYAHRYVLSGRPRLAGERLPGAVHGRIFSKHCDKALEQSRCSLHMPYGCTPSLGAPKLVIAGEHDPFGGPTVDEIADALPNPTVVPRPPPTLVQVA